MTTLFFNSYILGGGILPPKARARWGALAGGTGTDQGMANAVDSLGNIYVGGQYTSSIFTIYNFDGNTTLPYTLAPTGGSDVFVIKYNSVGVAQWATKCASTAADITYDIKTDSSGNVYLVGRYAIGATMTVYNAGGGTTLPYTLPGSGLHDFFIIKYNSSGIAQWATRIGGTGQEYGYGVCVDSSGNVYVTGYATSSPVTVYNAGGGVTLATLASPGTILVKYNSSGIGQWATSVSGVSNSFKLAVDSTGTNVYMIIQGSASTPVIYNAGGGVLSIPPIPALEQILLKYNSSGIAQWASYVDSTLNGNIFGLAIDSTNSNVYITGFFSGIATMYNAGGGTTLPYTLTSDNTDVFLVQYNSSGIAQWATRCSGTSAIGNDHGFSVYTYLNSVYLSGSFTSNPFTIYNVGNGTTISTLPNTGVRSSYIVKYNSSGIAQWATLIGGNSTDTSNCISVETSNIYISGTFTSNTLSIYNSDGLVSAYSLNRIGVSSSFLIKYSEP